MFEEVQKWRRESKQVVGSTRQCHEFRMRRCMSLVPNHTIVVRLDTVTENVEKVIKIAIKCKIPVT